MQAPIINRSKTLFAVIVALLTSPSVSANQWYKKQAMVGAMSISGIVLMGLSWVVYQNVKNDSPTVIAKNGTTAAVPFTFKRFWEESTATEKALFITGLLGAPMALVAGVQLLNIQCSQPDINPQAALTDYFKNQDITEPLKNAGITTMGQLESEINTCMNAENRKALVPGIPKNTDKYNKIIEVLMCSHKNQNIRHKVLKNIDRLGHHIQTAINSPHHDKNAKAHQPRPSKHQVICTTKHQ
jgi:hypothetical protein